MKKKFLAIPILILTLALVPTLQAKAFEQSTFEDLTFTEAQNVTTVITDTQGAEHVFSGALDVATLEGHECVEKIASYEILYDGETVLSVTLNDIIVDEELKDELEASSEQKSSSNQENSNEQEAPLLFNAPLLMASSPESKVLTNGYYAIRFSLNEGNKWMSLTGLTAANVSAVQAEIISSYATQKYFQFENIDFIDAEKNGDGDSMFCWAASACNMMQYSGWANVMTLRNAGQPYTTDDFLDLFTVSYSAQKGGYARSGIAWLFNNCKGWDSRFIAEMETEPIATGGFFTSMDWAYDQLVTHTRYNKGTEQTATEKFAEDMARLESGYAMEIDVAWEYDGAHALALWGYIYDEDFSPYEKEYYIGAAVTDSDSDFAYDKRDRRTIVNKLNIATMTPSEKTYDSWTFTFKQYSVGELAAVEGLAAYDESLPKETSVSATKDKHTTIDLFNSDIHLYDNSESGNSIGNTITDVTPIYIAAEISNSSDVGFSTATNVTYKIEVLDSTDTVIFSSTSSKELNLASYQYARCDKMKVTLEGGKETLNPGTYKVRVTLDPDNEVLEAYEYNNTYEETITVVENPVGDATISGKAGKFGEYYADVDLSYTGDYLKIAGHKYTIYQSFLNEDGTWSAYELATSSPKIFITDVEQLPERCVVRRNGAQVKFKLVITEGKVKSFIESAPVDLSYYSGSIITSPYNTYTTTPIENGAKELKTGENKGFALKNTSSISGPLTYHVIVGYPKGSSYDDLELMVDKDVTLSKGEMSDPILIHEWTKDIDKSKELIAKVQYVENQNTITLTNYLGPINMYEVPSTVVNYGDDTINNLDGNITLREAAEYAKTLKTPVTIAESFQGKQITLNNTLILEDDVTIDGLYTADGKEQYTKIYGTNKNTGYPLIYVGNNAKVILRGLRITYSTNIMNKYIFKNAGADCTFEKCNFDTLDNYSDSYVMNMNGGTTTFKQSFFAFVSSSKGAAFEVGAGAKANFLNCQINNCIALDNVLHNNGGELNMVYCSVLNNPVDKKTPTGAVDAKGGYAVIYSEPGSVTNVLGCMVINEPVLLGQYSIAGNVNVMNSLYGKVDDAVKLDSDSKAATMEEVAECEKGSVKWIFDYTNNARYKMIYTPLEAIAQRAMIKVSGENLAYQTSSGTWVDSGVKAFASDAEYQIDIMDKDHSGFYGAVALEITPAPMTGDRSNITIYIVIAGACLAVIIAIVIILVVKKKKDKDNSDEDE